MLQQDIAALTARFFDTPLTYTDASGVTVVVPDSAILVDNQSTTDVDETGLWVRFSIDPGAGQRSSLGDRLVYRQLGQAYLQVFIPEGQGTAMGGEVRDAFLAAFRDWTSDDGALAVTRTSNTKFNREGYVQMNIEVSWESIRTVQ